jgi:hypothetical protein
VIPFLEDLDYNAAMNRHALRSYGRTHKLDGAVDAERNKIKSEKEQAARGKKRVGRLVQKLVQDPLDDSIIEHQLDLEREALKATGNAKTHKKRLKDLQRLGLQ